LNTASKRFFSSVCHWSMADARKNTIILSNRRSKSIVAVYSRVHIANKLSSLLCFCQIGMLPNQKPTPYPIGSVLGSSLILSLISYVLAHWAYLSTANAARRRASFASTNLPDWGQAAEIAFQTIFPHLVVLLLLQDIERLRDLARKSWN
jgi:hypothetical protein